MTLYCKAGPDGTSNGDCPFAHFVRLVLEEKKLPYELKPSVQATKPDWLIEHYEGKMPALRHGKECYVESDVIAEYLDFFFPDPPLQPKKDTSEQAMAEAANAVDGFFPAFAKYCKYVPEGDEQDAELRSNLEASLSKLNQHLQGKTFLLGDQVSMEDLRLSPKLYHMSVALKSFKPQHGTDVKTMFPALQTYMDTMFALPSFQATVPPPETVEWGWGSKRVAQ